MEPVNVEAKLAVDRFEVDEECAHIEVGATTGTSRAVLTRLVRACPAGLYEIAEDGSLDFDYAGCLECGTCYVLGRQSVLERWEYPRGGVGIEYRWG